MHLREEIKRVQSQLKSAIQSHQMIVFKLKTRPVSTELRIQMNKVQRHIVSLGERQKKLLQELRRNLEINGGNIKQEKHNFSSLFSHKPSPLSSALALRAMQLNVKKEIKKDPDESDMKSSVSKSIRTQETPTKVTHSHKKKVKNVGNPLSQRNGHAPAPSPLRKESTPSSTPSSSPTHGHGSSRNSKQRSVKQENSCPPSPGSDESQDAFANLSIDPEVRSKLQFMTGLGLITREVLAELQSRRTERKRRSTANPQFLYGNNIDQAMKRKKINYLLSSNSTVPDNSSSDSLLDESNRLLPSSSCCVCSLSKGALSKCASCSKTFHWHCSYDSSQPKSGNSAKCKQCRSAEDFTMDVDIDRESTKPVALSNSDIARDQ